MMEELKVKNLFFLSLHDSYSLASQASDHPIVGSSGGPYSLHTCLRQNPFIAADARNPILRCTLIVAHKSLSSRTRDAFLTYKLYLKWDELKALLRFCFLFWFWVGDLDKCRNFVARVSVLLCCIIKCCLKRFKNVKFNVWNKITT